MLTVGRIDKPHGVRGEVLVTLVTDRLERVRPGAVLTTSSGRVLHVTSSTPHQDRHIVRFREVDDREGAEALRGQEVLAEPIDDPDVLWVHELIGSEVVDADGARIGVCEAVQDNPAADLLVLDDGRLIPVTFVVASAPGRVTVDPPPGLLDL